MTNTERRELIHTWHNLVTNLDNAWETWRGLGVSIEAPFPNAAWQLVTAYTYEVQRVTGSGDCLGWFLWEKPKEGGLVKIPGQCDVLIQDIGDLLNFLEAHAWGK